MTYLDEGPARALLKISKDLDRIATALEALAAQDTGQPDIPADKPDDCPCVRSDISGHLWIPCPYYGR